MSYDTVPIHGNPNRAAFGVIGERVSSDIGAAFIKIGDDTLNVGWTFVGTSSIDPTPAPSVTPSLTPTVTPTITITPTITPTVTITPTITPTVTCTPSITPTYTPTPTVTPSSGSIPTTYYTLYTTSSIASRGPVGENPGSSSIELFPPGGIYSAGTVVTIYTNPDSNSSSSLYKDGVLVATSTASIATPIVMNSNHTASVVLGWREVFWRINPIPAIDAGWPFGTGVVTESFAKKGASIYINANANESASQFVNWTYTNSPPTNTASAITTCLLSNDGIHGFTANYIFNSYIIVGYYSGTTGTSSFSYYDATGSLQYFSGHGTLGGSTPTKCGRLFAVSEGTAFQTVYSC